MKNLFFGLLLGLVPLIGSAQTITTSAITGGPFCPDSPVSINFTVSADFNTNNIFTAELSDASGSFASPTSIGTLPSITSGTINATIPSNPLGGTGYRIRVIADDPTQTGTNEVNLTIIVVTATTSKVDVSCNAGTDGSITVNASGGTPDYTFDLSGTATATQTQTSGDYTFSGLAFGTYNISVKDVNNCSITQITGIQITQPDVLTASVADTDVSCNGAGDGSINITSPAGGYGTYQYSIDGTNWQSSGNFTALAPATYPVSIRDAAQITCVISLGNTIITQPDVLTASVADTDVSCNGAGDGSINITSPAGGYGTYQYSIDGTNWQSSGNFTALAPATYPVSIRDAAQITCVISLGNTIITQPDVLTASVADTDVSCNGAGDGSINITSPAGGYGTYQYSIDGTNWQSSGNFTALAPATYPVSIRDAAQITCVISLGNTIITQPDVLTASVADTDVSCNGAGDGSINITSPAGGYGTYQYSIDGTNWQSSGNFTALAPATYPVSIRDAAQITCVISLGNTIITQPDVLTASVADTDVSCNGAGDGSINITSPAGGYGTYQYSIDGTNWQSSGNFTALAPATYPVSIRDAAQITCVISLGNTIITQPDVLTASVADTDVSCNGAGDGSINITSPAGGYGTYQYSIDGTNWQSSGNFTALAPATYPVSIRDAAQITCVISLGNTIITQPDVLTASVADTDVSCNGAGDGSINITSPAGGYGTYQYSIDGTNWQSSGNFTALAPATYPVSIRDAAQITCVISLGNTIITQPDVLTASVADTDVSCNGAGDGSINITSPAGGYGTYQYSIDGTNWQSSGNFTALAPATYPVSIRDAAQITCVISLGNTIITQPDVLTASVADTDVSCNGAGDGSINITSPAGGYGTYQYSIDGTNWQSSGNFTALAPATYPVSIRDAAQITCVISLGNTIITQPDVLTASVADTDVSCNGAGDGSINITSPAGGYGTYQYSIDGTNWQSSGNFTALAPATYPVSIRDAAQITCVISLGNTIITQPDVLTASVADTDVSCNGAGDGSINITSPAGGYGTYQYSIDGTNWQSSGNFTALAPATYPVSIRDAAQITCVISLGNTIITQPDVLTASVADTDVSCNGAGDGSINITSPAGGYGTYQYSIDGTNWQSSGNFTALAPATYPVSIRDAAQITCVISLGNTIITQPDVLTASVADTDVSCNGAGDGSINITSPAGGYGTYQYSIDGTNWQSSGNFTALAPATYPVSIRDAAQITCVISLGNTIITQPDVLTASVADTDVSCNGAGDGSINITSPAGGYGTYQYSIDGTNWQSSGNFTALAPATYPVSIRDAAQITCVISLGNTIITQPDVLTASVADTDVSCNGAGDGSINITSPAGGYGTYQYSIDGTNWQSSGNFTALAPATYPVSIRDAAQITCVISLGNTIITQPDVLTASVADTDVSCNGAGDGSINITSPAGGYGTYQYSIDGTNWQSSGNFTALAPATYPVSIRDAAQITCVISLGNTIITQPDQVTISESHLEVKCKGDATGSINVTVTGGTAPYTYDWGGGIITEDLFNLVAGTYNLTVTDNNGCVATLPTVTIVEPTLALTTSSSKVDIGCFGESSGAIDLTVSGGTAGYTFEWSTSNGSGLNATAQNQSDLSAGTYDVTVTDANLCTSTASIIISQPAAILGISITKSSYNGSDISCPGADDGVINIIASGGTPNYTFKLNGGSIITQSATNYSYTNLADGTYTIDLEDANGCTVSTQNVVLSDPTIINATSTITNVSCFQGNNGIIMISPSGGTGALSYDWSTTDGQGLAVGVQDQTGLTVGTYSLIISDANGCTFSSDYIITEPTELIIGETHSPVTCNDDFGSSNDGIINITPSGGSAPYTYSWNDGSTNQNRTTLSSGIYEVTVTDAKGCVAVKSIDIILPPKFIATATYTDVTCFDDNGAADDGTITVTVTGGTGNYDFAWSTTNGSGLVATDQNQAGLSKGLYTLTVKDDNNCTTTLSVNIDQPDQLVLSTTHTNVTCYDDSGTSDDGSINLTINGGSGFYSISWSNGATSEDLQNLPAGVYTVTVTEPAGCIATQDVTITQPDRLAIAEIHQNVTCNDGSGSAADGSIDISVSGGTSAYSYLWSNGATTPDITNLLAGDYTIQVTDANGCKSSSTITITEPPALVLSETHVNANCSESLDDGSIDLTVTGGIAPYTYAWSNGETTEDITGLAAGDYSVTVTDATGCITELQTTITKPGDIVITTNSVTEVTCYADGVSSADGAIDISVSGGTPSYSYLWSNGATTQNISGLVGGDYTITITDGNGCTANLIIPVFQPENLTVTETHQDVLCYDGTTASNDGAIDINVTGGRTPYTFAWSNGATSEDLSSLSAGTYDVTIKDANDCSTSISVQIDNPTPINLTEVHANVICNDDNGTSDDGTIDVTVSGGTGAYSFQWSNNATTEDLSGLAAGDYTLTVTDDNSCSEQITITITQPDQLVIAATVTDITCNDDSGNSMDGSIDLSVTGGTESYTYAWSNSSAQPDISSLDAGVYTVIVTDANGCTAEMDYTIVLPDKLTITSTITHVSCFDDAGAGSDGAIDISVTGGAGSYAYSWSSGETTEDLSMLVAGTYTLTVTDANLCQSVTSIIINNPPKLELSETHNNVTCNDDEGSSMDGLIDLSVTGGTGNYIYSWTNGATSQDISALGAGDYTVTVKDQNDCSAQLTITITEPVKLVVSESHTNVTCNEAGGTSDDGTITISVAGGTGAYDYSWDNGSNSQNLTGLAAGSYTLTVLDASGCSAKITVVVTQPDLLTIAHTFTNISCNDDSGTSDDGAIDVTVSGGTVPYTYSWSTGQTTADISMLPAGIYTLTVTDNLGCIASTTVSVSQPDKIVITESHADVTCNDDNGTSDNGFIDLTVAGGTGNLSYSWTNAEITQDISGLVAGSYEVTVTDENGCQAKKTIIISQPDQLVITETHANVTCFDDSGLSNDGQINITVQGGTGSYTYAWSNGETTQDINNLGAGDYTVTVLDANGCIAVLQIEITQPEQLIVTEVHTNVICYDDNGLSDDGTIDISVTGGTGSYSYSWSNGKTTQDINGLAAGIYSVIVKDQNNCESSIQIEITQPQRLLITETHNNVVCYDDDGPSNDGSIDITVQGGTGSYSYDWSNGATVQDLSGLTTGTYTLTVTDEAGCSSAISVFISNPLQLVMTVTNPNPVCQPTTVNITQTFTDNFDGTPTYWLNSDLTSEVLNPTAVAQSGIYYISQTTIDGCRVTRTVDVVVYETPDLIVPTLDVLCNDQSVDLTTIYEDQNNTTGTVTYWLDAATTQAIPDPTDIRTSGTYYIKKVTIDGCTDIEPFDIAITLQPNLVVTDPPAICFPGTVDITGTYVDLNNTTGTITFWKNASTTDPVADPTKIPESGAYYIQKTTVTGCNKTAVVNVVVNTLPNILVSSPEIICEGEIVNLTTVYTLEVPLPGTMTFYYDENHTNPITNPQSISTSGLYYYHFVSNAGCEDSEVLEVIVGQYPVLEVTNPDAVCEGEIVDIKPAVVDVANIDGTFTYWTDAALTIPLTDGLATETGTYFVQKESIYNCISSVAVDVLVNKIPMLSLTGVSETCSPNTINLAAIITDINSTTGSLTYWFDEALSNPVPNHTTISESGDYYIKKTTVFGACTDVMLVVIDIHQMPDAPIITLKEDTLFSNVTDGNQWFDESGIIAGATNDFYVPTNFGLYYVRQTLNNCQSDLSIGELYDPTGIFDESAGINFSVYPNPADNFITLVIEGFAGTADVKITDMRGIIIEQKTQIISSTINSVSIDMSHRKNGPYILSIIAGDKLYTQKLILR